jgi:hypothetical protein
MMHIVCSSIVIHNDNSNVALNELNTLIDNINTDSVTPDQVNGIVNDLGNVLLNAASSTFGQNQRRKKGKALNCIYKLVRNESIPIDLQLKMFD